MGMSMSMTANMHQVRQECPAVDELSCSPDVMPECTYVYMDYRPRSISQLEVSCIAKSLLLLLFAYPEPSKALLPILYNRCLTIYEIVFITWQNVTHDTTTRKASIYSEPRMFETWQEIT